jgi:hypothetical protein
MRFTSGLVASLILALGTTGAAAGTSVLVIGNSFLFGSGSAVRFYRADTVTDLNNEGIGGVPALFKSFTQEAGLDYDVSLETRGGSGLDFHLANKLEAIGRRGWDTVIMHGYSTLDADKPRDPAKLVATSKQMADFLRARNPKVDLYLMATWSRADETYPAKGAWAGQPIDAMAHDVRIAYDKAAGAAGAKAVIPVGEAWTRAIQTGVADPNPYDGIEAGKLNLWTYDQYHASTYGYYLEALVIFGDVTGRDPRSLGPNECSAYELGLSRAEATALQQVAFDQLASTGAVTAAPLVLPPNGPPRRDGRAAPPKPSRLLTKNAIEGPLRFTCPDKRRRPSASARRPSMKSCAVERVLGVELRQGVGFHRIIDTRREPTRASPESARTAPRNPARHRDPGFERGFRRRRDLPGDPHVVIPGAQDRPSACSASHCPIPPRGQSAPSHHLPGTVRACSRPDRSGCWPPRSGCRRPDRSRAPDSKCRRARPPPRAWNDAAATCRADRSCSPRSASGAPR